MRIVIAEDGGLFRTALTRVLEEAGFEVVTAVADAEALWAAVSADPPDVAIIDVRMPPTFTDEGLRAAERILASSDQTGVLVLTQTADAGHAMRLLGDGTRGIGYLLKDRVADVDELARRGAAGGAGRDRHRSDRGRLTRRQVAVARSAAIH